MTSKNSYFDLALILDKIRKSTWVITLYSVVLFFAMPVFLVIRMQGITERVMLNKERYIAEVVSGFFSMDSKFITFLAIPAAVIGAATVFHYLNSRKQMDFYHSLPIKREKLFTTNYLAGVIFYLIPYTVSVILSVIVLGGMGYISYLNPTDLVTGYLFNILLYLVVFTITVFAMILCGNLVVGLLGTTVFMLYGPGLCLAYTGSMSYFYKNYYKLSQVDRLMRNTSPIFDFMMTNKVYPFSAWRVVSYIVLTALLIVSCINLYKKRPSEASGRAMTFKNSRSMVKYPIVFLCTLISGIFFMSTGGRSMGWMIFGFVCGGVISHFIIEIIYHFDFKAIFKNIKGLGVFAVLFAIFISVPSFDMTGYDRKLPVGSDIKNVKINIMQFNQNSYFMNREVIRQVDYINRERAMLDRLTLSKQENIDAVLNIARMGVQNTAKEGNEYNASVGVEFELRNGSKITRKYGHLKSSEIEPYIISIFDTEEFKQNFYSLYSIDRNEVSMIVVEDLYARKGLDRSGQISDSGKIISLMDAVGGDILKQKAQTMKTETPVMLLTLTKGDPKEKTEWQVQVPVYPSFAQTIGILSSMGIETPKMITADMVDYINVNNYEYEKYINSSYEKDRVIAEQTKPRGNNEIRITDKKEIDEILKCIVPEGAVNYNPFFERNFGYRANVVSSRYLNGYSESFIFKKDGIPGFIKEKFPMQGGAK